MDDHVHPTLRGQALMAETFVKSMTNISAEACARIAPWEIYARKLGDNPYDHYVVNLNMRTIFNAPFMRANNPEAFQRFDEAVTQFENSVDSEVGAVMREWLTAPPSAGGRRPLTSVVARVLLQEGKFADALELFQDARLSVPEYTSIHMEYSCLVFECKAKLQGDLTSVDREAVAHEIGQGQVLLQRGASETGFTEYYLARLHHLRGEYAEAIPLLNASRRKLSGSDLFAVDQALIISYLKTGAGDQALQIAQNGVEQGGQYAPLYHDLLTQIEALTATNTNAPAAK